MWLRWWCVKHTPKYYDVKVDGLFALKDKSKPVKPFKLTFLSADIFFRMPSGYLKIGNMLMSLLELKHQNFQI